MAVTTVPKTLREKLGEDGAEALAAFMNDALTESKNGVLQIVEERFARRLAEEIGKLRAEMHEALASQRVELLTRMTNLEARVREEIANLRAEVRGEIANLRAEVRGEIANLRAEVKGEIADLRAEMHKEKASTIRWMFLFWITQMAAFLTLVWKFTP